MALWSVTAFVAVWVIFHARLWKRKAVFLLHIAFLVILAGALVSHIYGGTEQIHLRVRESRMIDDSTMILAYALLAVMALISAMWLCGKHELLTVSRALLRPAVFLLAAGIFIGAVWANMSWGRYWGWDPKEVWDLITMIIYSFPLHCTSLPIFKCDRIFAIWTLTSFAAVLMTYLGVNLLLGGLHSYA